MTRVQSPTESFGGLVSRIDHTRDVVHLDDTTPLPLLNRKILNVNVPRARGGLILVDHSDGCHVVLVEWSRRGLGKAELVKDRAKILGSLGGLDSRNELSFGRAGSNSGLHLGLIGNGTTSKTENQTSDGSTSLDVNGMGSIDETNKVQEIMGRERREGGIQLGLRKRDGRKRVNGLLAPVDNAPILSTAEVLHHTFHCHVVFTSRGLGESGEEGHGKSNVEATDDVGVDQFTKDLTVVESDRHFKISMVGSTFLWTDERGKGIASVRSKGNCVKPIALTCARCLPTMSLENPIDIGLTGQLDVIPSLMKVHTIVASADALRILDTNALATGRGMLVNHSDQLLCRGR